ncbi:FAD-binding and (Fe-S)-binding domain-containing protein [Prauserella sediminis]|uniref:FAD-binding and (Fe-S)-binding domain-containing protein n=1 Tax=Prauserella sediminis TaxID=577680 RepID=UPI0016108730|nr:FAD-binding and (Fe-S)-binding domain-containing protein [Prauserella sediminis]
MVALRSDLTTRAAYASDASIYRRVPEVVVEPRTEEDIRQALALAAQKGWPVVSRGGGTSVAGNAISTGMLIDTSRHFNRILSIDPDEMTAVVQPGVVCDQLRNAAAAYGLTYGPDPSTHARCTIGGMVGNNACGSHSVVWGTSAENLVAVTVMLADGRTVQLHRGGTSDPAIESALAAIRDQNLSTLRTELGQFPRQVSGYGLHHLLPENGFDVAKSFAGSEGTCGIMTSLTVRLVRKPAATALSVMGFDDVFDAAAAAPRLKLAGVQTIEGMGADLLTALRSRPGREQAGSALPRGGGWLYCEVGADTQDEAERLAAELPGYVSDLVSDSLVVTDPGHVRKLWSIREAGAGIVTRLPDGGEAWPGWEDSAVPAEYLSDYLRKLYVLLDELGLEGIPFGHFGEGCVHLRISFDLETEQGLARYRRFVEHAAELVRSYGGSVSGEHGDGRARSELLPAIYSPAALRAFRAFKETFDPDGVFNPGVLVAPEPIDQGVRPGPGRDQLELTPVHAFSRDGGSFTSAVNRCVGVGACRSDVGAMCPSFQASGDEVHSTRGRARVLAEMLRGESVSEGWKSAEVREALDMCLSCKACVSECPVNVDMATYKSEFLHHHYRRGVKGFFGKNRRPRAHFTMGWMPRVLRWLAKVPGALRLVNFVESFRLVEEFTKRLGGIEPRRRMIRFNPVPLGRWHSRRKSTFEEIERPAVVLWPDTFTNFASAGPGKGAVEVLEALGYRVLMPADDVCCGLTWHSTGQLDTARKVLGRTLDVMDPLIAGGYPVIGLEPSCAAVLKHEITELVPDDSRAHRVTELASSFGEFISRHKAEGGCWPFDSVRGNEPSRVLCQVHCHQKATTGYDAELEILASLGVDVDVVGGGCCGLAGNWGFEPGHFEMSQDLGERELYPKVRAAGENDIVLADGFSCRTQIHQGTDVESWHLAEVLAAALRAGR